MNILGGSGAFSRWAQENLKFRSSKTAGNAPKSRILLILRHYVGMHLYYGIKIVLHVVHGAKIGSAHMGSHRVLPYSADWTGSLDSNLFPVDARITKA